uniref:WRKY transcription factor 51 n=1 Tax=Santalum album TaxID=35974 RepID=A0A650C396_SANAL|nr:WRKY transcription factor 51 [Santalum album]
MGDDWDLLAVVRGCAAAGHTTSSAVSPTCIGVCGGPVVPSASFMLHNDENYSFESHSLRADPARNEINAFDELQELYKPFFPPPPPPVVPPPPPPAPPVIVPPINPSASIPGGFTDQQPQYQFQQRGMNSFYRNAPSVISYQHMTPRPRRRSKVHQKRMVTHVTADSLTTDMWAWRKYGQKPIKGSPHPRCSSSKGCTARRQVERSPSDPNIFIVTYSGDHSHPRPVHRNSLARASRGKFIPIAAVGDSEAPATSNSPMSTSSTLSPSTPLTDSMDDEGSSQPKTEVTDKGKAAGGGNNDYNDDDDKGILIPNMVMSEDIFVGMQELERGSLIVGSRSSGQRKPSSPSPSPLGRGAPAVVPARDGPPEK